MNKNRKFNSLLVGTLLMTTAMLLTSVITREKSFEYTHFKALQPEVVETKRVWVSEKKINGKNAWSFDDAIVSIHYWGGGSDTDWPGVATLYDANNDAHYYDLPTNINDYLFARMGPDGDYWGRKTRNLTFQESINKIYEIEEFGDNEVSPADFQDFTPVATDVVADFTAKTSDASYVCDASTVIKELNYYYYELTTFEREQFNSLDVGGGATGLDRINYLIEKYNITNADALITTNLAADKAGIVLPAYVAENFTLPKYGNNGAIITWESSNTNLINIDGWNAKVNPANATSVTLTATLRLLNQEDTRDITVTVHDPEWDGDVNDMYIPTLAGFSSARPQDPGYPHKEEDAIVRPAFNNFTFPEDARVTPTNQYLEFWHPETKLNVEIFGDPAIFALMDTHGFYNDDPNGNNNDLYWPVSVRLTVNGRKYVYYEVGMRRKGNTSRNHHFWDHYRNEFITSFSFKLKFDERWHKDIYAPFGLQKDWAKGDPDYDARDNRTIMHDDAGNNGMSKIDFKYNKTDDQSMTNQPFAFSFFQKHGLVSQNSTLTPLQMNGTRFGIITLNEATDKHLIRRYFASGADNGDLYKVGWGPVSKYGEEKKGSLMIEDVRYIDGDPSNGLIPDGIIGEQDKFSGYNPAYDAKELHKDTVNHGNLVNLMQVLKDNENKAPGDYTAALEAVVDMNSFLVYAAAAYLTGNPDDLRNNGNNYYIYFDPSDNNRAHFIPYDYDWAMGLGWDGNSANGQMGNIPVNHSKMQGNGRVWQEVRLFWYTVVDRSDYGYDAPFNITRNPAYFNTYKNNLIHMYDEGYYSTANFLALHNHYVNNYQDLIAADVDMTWSGFYSTTSTVNFMNNIGEQVNNIR
ncbi:MAG TPA: CotH kinase family protein [Bacilli bacterium]|nr:CotH kinase family protein [Bacilli bacterium]